MSSGGSIFLGYFLGQLTDSMGKGLMAVGSALYSLNPAIKFYLESKGHSDKAIILTGLIAGSCLSSGYLLELLSNSDLDEGDIPLIMVAGLGVAVYVLKDGLIQFAKNIDHPDFLDSINALMGHKIFEESTTRFQNILNRFNPSTEVNYYENVLTDENLDYIGPSDCIDQTLEYRNIDRIFTFDLDLDVEFSEESLLYLIKHITAPFSDDPNIHKALQNYVLNLEDHIITNITYLLKEEIVPLADAQKWLAVKAFRDPEFKLYFGRISPLPDQEMDDFSEKKLEFNRYDSHLYTQQHIEDSYGYLASLESEFSIDLPNLNPHKHEHLWFAIMDTPTLTLEEECKSAFTMFMNKHPISEAILTFVEHSNDHTCRELFILLSKILAAQKNRENKADQDILSQLELLKTETLHFIKAIGLSIIDEEPKKVPTPNFYADFITSYNKYSTETRDSKIVNVITTKSDKHLSGRDNKIYLRNEIFRLSLKKYHHELMEVMSSYLFIILQQFLNKIEQNSPDDYNQHLKTIHLGLKQLETYYSSDTSSAFYEFFTPTPLIIYLGKIRSIFLETSLAQNRTKLLLLNDIVSFFHDILTEIDNKCEDPFKIFSHENAMDPRIRETYLYEYEETKQVFDDLTTGSEVIIDRINTIE